MNYDDPNFPWLGWADWLATCGLEGVRPRAVLHFNHYDQLIQAAVAGQGVAIGRAELLSDLIARGVSSPSGPPAARWRSGATGSSVLATRPVRLWCASGTGCARLQQEPATPPDG